MVWFLLSRGRGKGGVKGIWQRFVEYGQMRHLPRTIRESVRSQIRATPNPHGNSRPAATIPPPTNRKDNTQCVSIMKNKPISWHYQIPHRLTAYHPECRTTKPLAFISIATRKATHPFRFSSSLLSAPRIFPHKFETASETFPPFDSS